MRPKKGTSLIEFLPNSRYEHVASAHPSYDFYEIFRDCGIFLLGHVLKFGAFYQGIPELHGFQFEGVRLAPDF